MKALLCAVPFILSTIYLYLKALNHYKNVQKRMREEELERLRDARFVNLNDDYKCIICVDRPRNVIMKPCLHFSICSVCYANLRKKVCPICKKPLNDCIEVFFN